MGKKRRQREAMAAAASPQPEASIGGGWGGGSRLAGMPAFAAWAPGVRDPDGDDAFELQAQRGYSRDLYRTSPVAGSGIDQLVAYRVGTGLRCQPRITEEWLGLTSEQAEEWQEQQKRRFEMWASDTRASVEGDQNFYEMQELIARSEVLSGDVFTILTEKERPGWPFRLALQVIEADRVCNENNGANTAEIFEGVRRAVDGEILSIFVANHHPGAMLAGVNKKEWREIPVYTSTGRRNILHRKKMVRPGQTRALPCLTKIIGSTKQLQRYTEAEIEAAVNSAAPAVFAQMDTESFKDLFSPDEQQQYLQLGLQSRQQVTAWQSGKILNTMPGETITSPTPGRPNPNFDGFVQPFFTLLGMGLNLPPEVLTGLYKSSYTAARAAFQQLWQMIYVDRSHDVTHTCMPVYRAWMDEGVSAGWIQAPGYWADPFVRHAWQGAEWTGSGPASLNPLQEAEAAMLRAQFLTDEQTETNAYDGGDHSSRHAQRAREAEARRRDGLPPLGAKGGAAPTTIPTPPSDQPPPADDEGGADDDTTDPLNQ